MIAVFFIVNILIPSGIVLCYERKKDDKNFDRAYTPVLLTMIVMCILWRNVYMIQGADEAQAVFVIITLTTTLLYSGVAAVKNGILEKPSKFGCVYWFVFGGWTCLSFLAPYVRDAFAEYKVFVELSFSKFWQLAKALVLIVVLWILWDRLNSFYRKIFAFPSVFLASLRWGYQIFSELGYVREATGMAGLPFRGWYQMYDYLCIIVLLLSIDWKAVRQKLKDKCAELKEFLVLEDELEDEEDESKE